jgi:hypothetical protein
VGNGSKKVHRCNPYPEHIECHAQVVKDLQERDDHDKIQTREVGERSSNNRLTRSFKTVRKREEVHMKWVRAAVAVAFPMIFFDNSEVHKTVLCFVTAIL